MEERVECHVTGYLAFLPFLPFLPFLHILPLPFDNLLDTCLGVVWTLVDISVMSASSVCGVRLKREEKGEKEKGENGERHRQSRPV